jgi:hypothetical protein
MGTDSSYTSPIDVNGLTRDVPVARQHHHHLGGFFGRAEATKGNPSGRVCGLPAIISVSIRAGAVAFIVG